MQYLVADGKCKEITTVQLITYDHLSQQVSSLHRVHLKENFSKQFNQLPFK